MIHPMEMHHISQAHIRIVRILDDAPERYTQDERWKGLDEYHKDLGMKVLDATRGRICICSNSIQTINNHSFHELILTPPIFIVDLARHEHRIRYATIANEYLETLQYGCLEAR